MEIDYEVNSVTLTNAFYKYSFLPIGNTRVNAKIPDWKKIDSQKMDELNVKVLNKKSNNIKEVSIQKMSNTDNLTKVSRRKSTKRELCRTCPTNNSIDMGSKSGKGVSSSTKTIVNKKENSKENINQSTSSVEVLNKLINKNVIMKTKSATMKKDRDQPKVDKYKSKPSTSAPHSSKSKSQDPTKLKFRRSDSGEYSVSHTRKTQEKGKPLKNILQKGDFNLHLTKKAKTVTAPSIPKEADLKKSVKKRLVIPSSDSDSNEPSCDKIKTVTNKKVLTTCEPNRENVKVLISKSLHSSRPHNKENKPEKGEKEEHSKNRKHKSKSVTKLEPPEKRRKIADDKVAKTKPEERERNRKEEKSSIKKHSNHSKSKTKKIEESKKEGGFQEVVTNSTKPALHLEPSSSSCITKSSLQLSNEKMCIIDLDDYPDDHKEVPIDLVLIKLEKLLEDDSVDTETKLDQTAQPHVTGESTCQLLEEQICIIDLDDCPSDDNQEIPMSLKIKSERLLEVDHIGMETNLEVGSPSLISKSTSQLSEEQICTINLDDYPDNNQEVPMSLLIKSERLLKVDHIGMETNLEVESPSLITKSTSQLSKEQICTINLDDYPDNNQDVPMSLLIQSERLMKVDHIGMETNLEISSPSLITKSTSQVSEEQICTINLDDYPDNNHEIPMSLLIKSERLLKVDHIGMETNLEVESPYLITKSTSQLSEEQICTINLDDYPDTNQEVPMSLLIKSERLMKVDHIGMETNLEISSPSLITKSTSQVSEEQICTINLDDYPDNNHEVPMSLLIKSEGLLKVDHVDTETNIEVSSLSPNTKSTSHLSGEQICTINLDDYPDNNQEIPMDLVIKSERLLKFDHISTETNLEARSPSLITKPSSQLSDNSTIYNFNLDDCPDDHQENRKGLLIKSEKLLNTSHQDLLKNFYTSKGFIESNLNNTTTEIEVTIIQRDDEKQPCFSDPDYSKEDSVSDAVPIMESITEEVLENSTKLHAEEMKEEKMNFAPKTIADVKPLISEVITVMDEDSAMEPLLKIEYSDFAAIFVDDFRYYNYVENSVYQFSVASNSSKMIENKDIYSELFQSRKLIFERFSRTMWNYLKKHEIVNFDCRTLIDEINKALRTNWNTTISHFKILRLLHNIILTWRKPSNDFIKMFCNNISHNMLLFDEEHDKGDSIRLPNSGSSEAVASNPVSSPQIVAAPQNTSEQNQQVEQNLSANNNRISPRPMEQFLENSSTHQSLTLLPSESQSLDVTENVSKQLDPHPQSPKLLCPSTQLPHISSQTATNQLSLPQSTSGSGALLPPPYNQENISTPSRSSTAICTSQLQPLPVIPHNQIFPVLQIPPSRMPANNAGVIGTVTNPLPIFPLSNMAVNLTQARHEFPAYPRYATQNNSNQSLTRPAQTTGPGSLHTTYYPRIPGMYSGSDNQQYGIWNLYGYNWENDTTIQPRAQMQQKEATWPQQQRPVEQSQPILQNQQYCLRPEIRSTGVVQYTDRARNTLSGGTFTSNLVQCNDPANTTGFRPYTTLPNHLVQNNVSSVSGNGAYMSPSNLMQSSASGSESGTFAEPNNLG